MVAVTISPTYGGYYLRFPFDEDVIASLRDLPKHVRRWVPEQKAWFVATAYLDRAEWILERRWPGCLDVPEFASSAPDPGPYAVLYLLPSAPPEVVKAAYRALSLSLHPDRGGDTAAMQRVNAAYDQIRT